MLLAATAAPAVCSDANLGVELELPAGWSFIASPQKVCAFTDGARASGEITVAEGTDAYARAEQVQSSLGAQAIRAGNVISDTRVVRSYTVGAVKIGFAFVTVDRGIATLIVADRGTRPLADLEKVANALRVLPVGAPADVIPLDEDPGRIVIGGPRLYVAAGAELLVVDIASKSLAGRIPAGGAITDLELDPGGKIVWCAISSRGLRAFDIASLTFGDDISIGAGEPSEMTVGRVFGKGPRVFVMRYPPYRVQEIDGPTGTLLGEMEEFGLQMSPVLSPDGTHLYVTTQGGVECGGGRDPIGIFDAVTGRKTGSLGPKQGCPAQVGSCLAITEDGRFLLNNGADAGKYRGFEGGVINVWDLKTETLAGTLKPGVALGCPQTAPGIKDRFFASIQTGGVQALGAWSLPALAKAGSWTPPDGGSFTGFVAFASGPAWIGYATYTAKTGGASRGIAIVRPGSQVTSPPAWPKEQAAPSSSRP